jgi:hypothetical protein
MDIHHRAMMAKAKSLMETKESDEKKNPKRNWKLNDGDSMEMNYRKQNNANKSSKVQSNGNLMWIIM